MTPLLSTLKHTLTQRLREHTPATLLIGLSGGVDSVVLLHALVGLRDEQAMELPPLAAMHINHGISQNAADWQAFCETLCNVWDVPFHCAEVTVENTARTSLEATARDKRYGALCAQAMSLSAAVLTAHHSDDQAETVLLQLKRGAGPKGLSGMAESSRLNEVDIWRPLLGLSRAEIERYASDHQLTWVEDESNSDTRYDRNFLRQALLPALQGRWPGFTRTVARSAALCASQQSLLEEVCDERLSSLLVDDGALQIAGLLAYSEAWQQALIRRWIEMRALPMPSNAQLEQILRIPYAAADRQPAVVIGQYSVRRFRDKLYIVNNKQDCDATQLTDAMAVAVDKPVSIDGMTISLSFEASDAAEQLFTRDPTQLAIRPAPLALPVKPRGEQHHKPLKQWCKLWNMPPWQRESLWLLFDNDEAVALLIPDKLKIVPLEREDGKRVYLSCK